MKGCTTKSLTDFVIVPSRYQAIIAVAIIAAFSLYGKEFISLWIGSQYTDAYYVALILMIPVSIPLIQNTCLAVLDAKLKRMFRSVLLSFMSLANILFSIIAVQHIGFWGAALGTALSLTAGHIVAMNIYYQRVIGLEVKRFFKEVFRGILPSGIVATLMCVPATLIIPDSVVGFCLKCTLFVFVYAVMIWMWGLNQRERDMVRRICKRND